MKYELRTIKDIFEKIPIDRLDDCMEELKILIGQCQAIRDKVRQYYIKKDLAVFGERQ